MVSLSSHSSRGFINLRVTSRVSSSCILCNLWRLFQTLSVLNPFRATEKTIFEDTDLAGPLVFCLAFGGFLLLVSWSFNIKMLHEVESWSLLCGLPMINASTVVILVLKCNFYLPPWTVWQSDIFLHLRHWSTRLFGVLLSPFINGNFQRHFGCCHFRFRLLSTSNGGVIGNKCFNHDSVSAKTSLKKKNEWKCVFFCVFFFFHRGIIGTVLTGFSIMWCAVSASKLFVTSLSMDHQQILIAYPAALFYGVFALITIF